MDSGLRALSVDLAVVLAGVVAAGVEVAGAVVVCAKAELASSSEETNAAAARDERVIIEAPVTMEKGVETRAVRLNRG